VKRTRTFSVKIPSLLVSPSPFALAMFILAASGLLTVTVAIAIGGCSALLAATRAARRFRAA